MEKHYKITTIESLDAPLFCRFMACWDDYDLDARTGVGSTEDEAIHELLAVWGLPKT